MEDKEFNTEFSTNFFTDFSTSFDNIKFDDVSFDKVDTEPFIVKPTEFAETKKPESEPVKMEELSWTECKAREAEYERRKALRKQKKRNGSDEEEKIVTDAWNNCKSITEQEEEQKILRQHREKYKEFIDEFKQQKEQCEITIEPTITEPYPRVGTAMNLLYSTITPETKYIARTIGCEIIGNTLYPKNWSQDEVNELNRRIKKKNAV